MIENANQYEVTKKQLALMQNGLEQLNKAIEQEGKVISILQHAQRDGVLSVIEELEQQLFEYDLTHPKAKIIQFTNK